MFIMQARKYPQQGHSKATKQNKTKSTPTRIVDFDRNHGFLRIHHRYPSGSSERAGGAVFHALDPMNWIRASLFLSPLIIPIGKPVRSDRSLTEYRSGRGCTYSLWTLLFFVSGPRASPASQHMLQPAYLKQAKVHTLHYAATIRVHSIPMGSRFISP